MIIRSATVLAAVLVLGAVAKAEDAKLPSQITPALRSACEADVRRVCVGDNATYSKVKSCVLANYMNFGKRCKIQIALAGLGR